MFEREPNGQSTLDAGAVEGRFDDLFDDDKRDSFELTETEQEREQMRNIATDLDDARKTYGIAINIPESDRENILALANNFLMLSEDHGDIGTENTKKFAQEVAGTWNKKRKAA